MDGGVEQHEDERESAAASGPYVVAIGGSAGALSAVGQLLSRLPAEFPAPVLVVIHLPAHRRSVLADLLDAKSPLRVAFAKDGDALERGRVYVAPPDLHLLVKAGKVILRRGPLENSSRPAIDPLFRSVATEYGSRSIAVVVSGTLSDGASGIMAVKRCGGTTIVQEPKEAEHGEMPKNALATGAVDHVVSLNGIAGLLIGLSNRAPAPSPALPQDVLLETRIAAEQMIGVDLPVKLGGSRSALSCPDCQGALWEIREGELVRYRCHVGHAFTADALDGAQLSELDRALGSALRIIDERIHVLRGLASEAQERQRPVLAAQWKRRMAEYRQQASLIRQVLMAKKADERTSEDA